MATKIILFVSSLPKGELKRECYACPDGSTVEGAQTNEAPVCFLLERYPQVSEILCIVTPEAEPAYSYLCDMLKPAWPRLALRRIPYREGEDFNGAPLSAILSAVQAGDEILLETTGGFRNAVMYLLLLSRVLSYVEVRTVYAVYSNFPQKRIEDISHLIGLFDLVGGMQELSSFGSARTLRTYYGQNPADPAVSSLLTALEQLSETITLCRTNQLGERMKAFNQALEMARDCADPLMRALIPAFREKFGKKLNTVSLIKWCVESDMLQQALTVYTERIPRLIMNRGDLLRRDESLAPELSRQEYEDPDAVQFLKGFLMLSGSRPVAAENVDQTPVLRSYVPAHIGEILRVVAGEPAEIPPELERAVENLALILRLAYPDGGSFRADWPERLPPEKAFLAPLGEFPNKASAPEGMLRNVGVYKREYLALLLEQDAGVEPMKADYVSTLQHLEELLPGSGYEVLCPMEQIETIARDYLYIKTLRNLANHANDTGTSQQQRLMAYLEPYGYPPLETITLEQMRQAILNGLDHLRTRRGKE